jgi:hypothetical protein
VIGRARDRHGSEALVAGSRNRDVRDRGNELVSPGGSSFHAPAPPMLRRRLTRLAINEGEGVAVFGRRRREAEVEARDAIMQTLARLERGLQDHARAQAVTDVTVQHLHSTVVGTRKDLIETVQYVYETCSLIIERTESAQLERQALIETLAELTGPPTIEPSQSGERVLGGSFPAFPAESADAGVEDATPSVSLDLVEVRPAEPAHLTSAPTFGRFTADRADT